MHIVAPDDISHYVSVSQTLPCLCEYSQALTDENSPQQMDFLFATWPSTT